MIKNKNKNKRVSLKDIAEKVGVSTALVSYVLNGQKRRRGLIGRWLSKYARRLKR
jgi:LacI family transcriptional regulator